MKKDEEHKKTCFVISPIGPDGSDTRKRANAFLKFLVSPALEKYDFRVIRADTIPTPTAITSDIVKLVQESDLCIIDLTDNNPNVYYECGRRHETGRPFIQLMDKNSPDKIPFDLAGIRTIFYDLSTLETAHDSIKELQEYITAIVDSGFPSTASGDSMSSIAQALERIERKVGQLQSGGSFVSGHSGAATGGLERILTPPAQLFHDELLRGELESAFNVAVRLHKSRPDNESWARFMFLASAGHEASFDLIRSYLVELLSSDTAVRVEYDFVRLMVGTLKRYSDNALSYEPAIEGLKEILSLLKMRHSVESITIGFCANLIGMCNWSQRDYEGCEYFTQEAIGYCPDDPSYHYNLCLVYKQTGSERKLKKSLENLSKCEGLDADHINLLKSEGFW